MKTIIQFRHSGYLIEVYQSDTGKWGGSVDRWDGKLEYDTREEAAAAQLLTAAQFREINAVVNWCPDCNRHVVFPGA